MPAAVIQFAGIEGSVTADGRFHGTREVAGDVAREIEGLA